MDQGTLEKGVLILPPALLSNPKARTDINQLVEGVLTRVLTPKTGGSEPNRVFPPNIKMGPKVTTVAPFTRLSQHLFRLGMERFFLEFLPQTEKAHSLATEISEDGYLEVYLISRIEYPIEITRIKGGLGSQSGSENLIHSPILTNVLQEYGLREKQAYYLLSDSQERGQIEYDCACRFFGISRPEPK